MGHFAAFGLYNNNKNNNNVYSRIFTIHGYSKNTLLEIHQIQCKRFLKPIKAKLLAMAMID